MCLVLVMCVICKFILVNLLNEIVLLIGFLVSGLFGLIVGVVGVRFFFEFLIMVLIFFIFICCIIGLNLLMVWFFNRVCSEF